MEGTKIPDYFSVYRTNVQVKSNLCKKFHNQEVVVGAKQLIKREFLTLLPKELKIVSRQYCVHVYNEQKLFIVRLELSYLKEHSSTFGVHPEFKKAYDMACWNQIMKLMDEYPSILMVS